MNASTISKVENEESCENQNSDKNDGEWNVDTFRVLEQSLTPYLIDDANRFVNALIKAVE